MTLKKASDGSVALTIRKHVERLELVPKLFEKQNLITARARGSYVVAVRWPGLKFEFAKAIQLQDSTKENVAYFNRAFSQPKQEPSLLRFVRIDPKTEKVVIMTDEALRTNPNAHQS